MMKKIDKHYVSPITKKLIEFDRQHPKSANQLSEIEKYRRIYQLRDQKQPSRQEKKDSIWEDF